MKKIVCFHIYNDYSGSPKVLTMILEGLLKKNYAVDLFTSGKGGSLDKLENFDQLSFHRYTYSFSNNKIVEMIRYIYVQLYIFFGSFRYLFRKNTVFYINTLLPVGGALAGWIMRKHIVYHYHENASVKGGIYKILSVLMQYIADDIICVSEYQTKSLVRKDKVIVIPNVLEAGFTNYFGDVRGYDNFEKKNILMLSSLKVYKGIKEFVYLAQNLPDYHFTLVINDNKENIENFLTRNTKQRPGNLDIYARQNDVKPFYRDATIVLNLSDKNKFVETFGLTVLEAFTAGVPVIVPTIGGVAEIVDEDINGYKIDVADIDKISSKIKEILSEKEKYSELRENAIKKSQSYDYSVMIEKIERSIVK